MRTLGLGLLAMLSGGCDCVGYQSTSPGAEDASAEATPEPDAAEPGCDACATGDLAGVALCVASDRCTFAVGEGGTFDVTVSVDRSEPIHAFGLGDPDRCSECFWATEDPVSHVALGIWSEGSSVHYCPTCDLGCCSLFPRTEITLTEGEHATSFEWPGLQWNGESDTLEPYGDPFPPGDYFVRVVFHHAEEGGVEVELPIAVVQR